MKILPYLRIAFFISLVAIAACLGEEQDEKYFEKLTVFLEADSVSLLSIDPPVPNDDPFGPKQQPKQEAERSCHGYPILGEIDLVNEVDLAQLRTAIRAIGKDGRAWDGRAAVCFWPRHCLKIETATGVLGILICYQCTGAQFVVDEDSIGFIQFGTANPTASPQIFNRLLKKYKVPLATAPNK